MNRPLRIAAALALVLVGLAARPEPAPAACDARLELERAAEAIDRATDPVLDSGVREARELLRAARVRLDEGRDKLRRNRPAEACLLARAAQQLAKRAVEISRNRPGSLSEIEHILERSRAYLDDAAEVVTGSPAPGAKRMLDLAFQQQREGETAFRGGRHRLAIKLTLMARNTADRARRLAEGAINEDGSRVKTELDDTDRLLEEAGRVVVDGDGSAEGAAVDLLDRARALQAEARRHHAGGRPGLALRLTRQARLLATQALDRIDVRIDRSEVEPMIASTGELLDRLTEEAAGDAAARDLLLRARGMLEDARRQIERGEARDALASIRGASMLAQQVSERLSPGNRE